MCPGKDASHSLGNSQSLVGSGPDLYPVHRFISAGNGTVSEYINCNTQALTPLRSQCVGTLMPKIRRGTSH